MAEPALSVETTTSAGQLCEQAARAVAQGRPFFVVVFYRHEGEKLDFLEAVWHQLHARGLHSRTYDPAHRPEHSTGKLYGLLAEGGADTIHLVADLARSEDGGFDRAFLDYLNLHRDTISRERLRMVLFVHQSEAEAFLRAAGDLWDFRQRTIWLERPVEPRGEGLWQEVLERSARLPKPEAERQEIEGHIAEVRAQADATSDPGERAGLLLDLATWLLRRHAAAAAAEVAREGLHLAPLSSTSLHLKLEMAYATALRRQEQNPEALRHLERALSLSQESGDRINEATILNEISQIYRTWGRNDEALQNLQQSLQIHTEIGDRAGEATNLNNIATIYHARGRYDDALQRLQQSLQIRRELGDRASEAVILNNISQVYRTWGRRQEELEHLLQSLQINREFDDRKQEAITLNNIAGNFLASERPDEAIQHLQQSLQISRENGDRAAEAITLNNIAAYYHASERHDEAFQHLQESLHIRREIGDRAGEANSLNNIALVDVAQGRHDEALQHLQQSLLISREIGNRAQEAVALNNLGREHNRRGALAEAVEYLRASVALEEELKHPDAAADREYLGEVETRLRQQVAQPKSARRSAASTAREVRHDQ
jgi:tetratricopeptide (TPR) repeat protein